MLTAINLIGLENCIWSAWNTEYVNGHKRVCQQLDCKGDRSKPEKAWGKRNRRILQEPGPGIKPCAPNGERSLEDCEGDCPGE